MKQILSRQDAQRQVERVHDFRECLNELEKERVLALSAEDRLRVDDYLDQTLDQLTKRFDVDVTESQRQISLGMRVISALGGLALCIAVFLFFYRIWGLVTTPVQVSILAAVPLAMLAATEIAARRERTLYFASLLALVALASFVLNLTVLGTIFNITASHRAFLAWGAFALILAYRYRLRIQLAAGLLSLLAFFSASVMTWQGCNWLTLGERPENCLPLGLVLFAIPALRSVPGSTPCIGQSARSRCSSRVAFGDERRFIVSAVRRKDGRAPSHHFTAGVFSAKASACSMDSKESAAAASSAMIHFT